MYEIEARYESETFYKDLESELLSMISGEKNLIANLANISSWIYHAIPDLNWCGFYLWQNDDGELVLGPFQGRPACIRIRPERGVCGAAYTTGQTIRVEDVHDFPGHIACDAASISELVIPLNKNGIIYGVLDLDSPSKSRFKERDEKELTRIMGIISNHIF
jgi:L-methionine (R)-S-oxide reductase